MNPMLGDWRPIAIIAIVLLLLVPRGPYLTVVLLALGAWLALRTGLAAWRGAGRRGGPKVTYWRGRRIEIDRPERTSGRLAPVGPTLVAVLCLALGLWLAYAALLMFARLVAGAG